MTGRPDLLWWNKANGNVGVWYMNAGDPTTLRSPAVIYQGVSLDWQLVGTGDFDNDGQTDLLWWNKANGNVGVWYMNAGDPTTLRSPAVIYQGVSLDWQLVGTGDFDNDRQTDLLWWNKTNGNVAVWYMNAGVPTTLRSPAVIYQGVSLDWQLVGTGDFDNDGQTDLLWWNKANGNVAVWYMNAGDPTTLRSPAVIYQGVSLDWQLIGR